MSLAMTFSEQKAWIPDQSCYLVGHIHVTAMLHVPKFYYYSKGKGKISRVLN